jgi:uncharacterized protein (DUF3820 family)
MKHLIINATTQGFVYLIHQSNTPYFKIGTTQRDPYKRLRAMQTGNAMKLDMVLIMEFQNARSMENNFHRKFKEKRIVGSGNKEWFTLTRLDWVWLVSSMSKYVKHMSKPKHLDGFGDKVYDGDIQASEIETIKEYNRAKAFRKHHTGFKSIVVPFGKYKGRKLYTTLIKDRDYFEWLASKNDCSGHAEFFKALKLKLKRHNS